MANDIDLYGDIEKEKNKKKGKLLAEYFHYRYIEYDEAKAEQAKSTFESKYGYWDNY